jgi:AcrR family transcriptional regulator/SOS-response transcriptional repressor LexA
MAAEGMRRSHGSDLYVSSLQRGRLLSATFALVDESGYGGVSARSVSERAGVSNRTFYQCFSDREDCFLAAFNYAVDGLELEVREAWESQLGWSARVRAALSALLRALDREPAVRRLVFVEALAAGPRVLACRARVLESLTAVVDEGRLNAKAPSRLPALVAEGVVGATFGVIHARVLELRPEPLVELHGSLMATIVLPYRGSAAAARELQRPPPRIPARRRDGAGLSRRELRSASPVDYRLTVRTQMALAAVAGRPGLNNHEVSEIIGLPDQSQISRMMKRLSDQGLVENTQGHAKRQVRAWRLTSDGEAVIDAHRGGRASIKAQRKTSRGRKLVAKGSGRRGKNISHAGTGSFLTDKYARPLGRGTSSPGRPGENLQVPRRFRLTALTHEVLAQVASLSAQGTNPSNREVGQAAGVKDQGQISKLLARLQTHGLLENTGGGYPAAGNAWRLTSRGEELLCAGSLGEHNSNDETGAAR